MVQSLSGVVQGVPLSALIPSFIYDLDDEVAAQLIELRAAVAVRHTDIPTVESFEDVDISWLSGGVHVVQPDTAHDRRRRRRRSR